MKLLYYFLLNDKDCYLKLINKVWKYSGDLLLLGVVWYYCNLGNGF